MHSTVVLADVGLDSGLPPSDSFWLALWASEKPGWLGELGNLALSETPVHASFCIEQLVPSWGSGSGSRSMSRVRSRSRSG